MIRPAVNLHVSHSWGGGLARWVRDFAAADTQAENLVLQSRGTQHAYGLGLRLADIRTRRELERWALERPITEIADGHDEYRKILESVLARHGVTHLYVSSLVGHSLESLRCDVATTVVLHDYFPYCPALYLTREETCTRCGSFELALCTESNRFFRPSNPAWLYPGLRNAYLETLARRAPTLVCPTPGIARNLRRIDPRFRDLAFHVIEHGCDLERHDLFGGAPDGRRLRAVVLGRLDLVKGEEFLCDVFERARLVADFSFLGAGRRGARFERRWATTVIERYRRRELPRLLLEAPCDMALFFSAVPESFSYTLSEVWSLGLPAVAPRRGAFADRVVEGENGYLYEGDRDSLVDLLLAIDSDRSQLRRAAATLATRPLRSTRQMVEDYYALRRDPRAFTTEAAGRQQPV